MGACHDLLLQPAKGHFNTLAISNLEGHVEKTLEVIRLVFFLLCFPA
jgi:hypothetical protein